MRLLRWSASVLVIVVLAMSVAGCGSAADDGSNGASSETPTEPGLYDVDDGKVQALGVLEYFPVEGGFWAVVNRRPGEPASVEAPIVAVVLNANQLDIDLESLGGAYVLVTGERSEAASVRMSGPEILADSIERVVEASVDETGAGD